MPRLQTHLRTKEEEPFIAAFDANEEETLDELEELADEATRR